MEKIPNIETSTDYSQFKLMKGNRGINPLHVGRLKKAVERKNLLPFFPVIVNEKMEIADGQHRFTVAKQIDSPVYYIVVPGVTLADVQQINTSSLGWNRMDYFESFIELGVPQYLELKRIMDQCDINLATALTFMRGGTNVNGTISENFKRGKLEIKEEDETLIVMKSRVLHALGEYDVKVSNKQSFIVAVSRMCSSPEFDEEVFLAQLERANPTFMQRITYKEYLRDLENIYNYRRQRGFVRFN